MENKILTLYTGLHGMQQGSGFGGIHKATPESSPLTYNNCGHLLFPLKRDYPTLI